MSFFPLLGALSSRIQYYKYRVGMLKERVETQGVSTAEYWFKVLEAVNRV